MIDSDARAEAPDASPDASPEASSDASPEVTDAGTAAGTPAPRARAARAVRPDAVSAKAVDLARAAVVATAPEGDVGEHLDVTAEGERVVTHRFRSTRAGYDGWVWSVTLVRALRAKVPTVNEVVLVPGDAAIVAPPWVPYRDRVQAGDLSPGDLLPVEDDDPRLAPGWTAGDEVVDARTQREVIDEPGLGRKRLLSLEGRDAAAERWYFSDRGPESPLAKQAPGPCASCGFLVNLRGPLSTVFGVCANAFANDDGSVVSLDHGCGAHSDASLGKKHQPQPLPEHVWDTTDAEELETF